MKDPIGSFENHKENLYAMWNSVWKQKFEGVEKRAEWFDELRQSSLSKTLIEPLPDYVSSGKKNDLTAEDLGNALNWRSRNIQRTCKYRTCWEFPFAFTNRKCWNKHCLEIIALSPGTGSGKNRIFFCFRCLLTFKRTCKLDSPINNLQP